MREKDLNLIYGLIITGVAKDLQITEEAILEVFRGDAPPVFSAEIRCALSARFGFLTDDFKVAQDAVDKANIYRTEADRKALDREVKLFHEG